MQKKERAVQHHSPSRLSYDDYVRFPDDGLRHEIIEGEHYVTPSPSTRHQRILRNLSHIMQNHLDQHPSGELFFAPFDVLLSEFNVFVPDLVYLSNARGHLLTSKNLQGAPDLAVEILSPGTGSRDRRLKRDVYARTGVEEYWLIDPAPAVVEVFRKPVGSGAERAFTEHRSLARDQTVTTALLPGFALRLDRLFTGT